MKTFKQYFNESVQQVENAINRISSAYDGNMLPKQQDIDIVKKSKNPILIIRLIRIHGILSRGDDIKQKDVDFIIKNTNQPIGTRPYIWTICSWCIKYNKKIPSEFIKFMEDNMPAVLDGFIKNIKNLPDIKKRLPEIIKRNPELLEYFI